MTPDEALKYLDSVLGNVTQVASAHGPSGLTRQDQVQIQQSVSVLQEAIKAKG